MAAGEAVRPWHAGKSVVPRPLRAHRADEPVTGLRSTDGARIDHGPDDERTRTPPPIRQNESPACPVVHASVDAEHLADDVLEEALQGLQA
jgi:hypothetical protein